MKLFSANQIKAWDEFTIQSGSISRIELMERAAGAAYDWLIEHFSLSNSFFIFCGPGNNGVDGLIISRKLIEGGYRIQVFIAGEKNENIYFNESLEKIKNLSPDRIHNFDEVQNLNFQDAIIIDALFGTGLNRPLDETYTNLVEQINESSNTIISIDVPSGLFSDSDAKGDAIVKAGYTLTFEAYKPSFLIESSAKYLGEIITLPIGLSKEFYQNTEAKFEIIDEEIIQKIYKKRSPFGHKGNFGHAAIMAGSYGMMGAAVLASRSCLKIGAGKVTAIIPECGYQILQIANPEVMCKVYGEKYLENVDDELEFSALGIGPGMGIKNTDKILSRIFKNFKQALVLDADALNAIGENKDLLNNIPPNTILTPHPKELERLFGVVPDGMEKFDFVLDRAARYNIIIVLKGHYTFIATPAGKGYFNTTGNAGMATAGSGDVLTGIITGLLAQGYSQIESTILGVYIHGMAGTIAAKEMSQESLVAGDIIESLGKAFLKLNNS